MRQTGNIINDLIQHVYDTERTIRIMGEDGKIDVMAINKAQGIDPASGDTVFAHDITAGSYDVAAWAACLTMQPVKTLRFVFVSGVASVTTLFLTVATLQFAAPPADATLELAKGKSCKSCRHSSGSPSKSDVKKKSELWPDSIERVKRLFTHSD